MFKKILDLFRIKQRKKEHISVETKDVLDIKLEDQISLPTGVRESLRDSNIHTIRDFLSLTPQQILLLPNVDLPSYIQLLDFLEKHGIVIEKTQENKEQFIYKAKQNVQKQKLSQDILDMRFDEQPELSARIINALNKENIQTVADIMPYNRQQLSLLPNIGTTSLNKLIEFLEAHNIFIGIPYESTTSNKKEEQNTDVVSVRDFLIKTYDKKTSDILIAKYEGCSLADLGKQYGLSRQRICQICDKVNWPKIKEHFKEDVYRDLFQKYRWDTETFCYITRANKFTYGYLSARYKRGEASPEEFFPDGEALSQIYPNKGNPVEVVIKTSYCGNLKYEKIMSGEKEYMRITRYARRKPYGKRKQ